MNLSAKTFDAGNARECAAASALAYTALPSVVDAHTDTQVLVLERADHIIIAFRGSSSVHDFIIDARFFRHLLVEEADGERCEVHAGFLAAYESVIVELPGTRVILAFASRASMPRGPYYELVT